MEQVLALISIGQNVYSKWLLRQLLYGAMVGVSLTIVTSTLVGAMLVASFYALYIILLHAGYNPQSAMIIIGGAGFGTTLLFILFTCLYIRNLKEMPMRLLKKKLPQMSQANDVVDAFINGFLGKK